MKVKYTVHQSHLPLWENKDWRYAIVMGGRGNGRSGTASRYVVSQLLSKEYNRGAIMRAVREDIRASCWSDINDRLTEQEINNQFKITEHDMFIGRGKNSLRAHGFRASSGSLTARLKSLAGYNLVWIEEAEEIGEDEFRTLDDTLRTVEGRIKIILTLNTPPKNHWLIKKWFELEEHKEAQGFYIPKLKEGIKDVVYLSGTWRDNEPNLDYHTIKRYQGYKKDKPAYYWQMIEGLSPEVVMGRIYGGWREIDEVPHEARLLGYGLDFGYDPDPAAIVAIYYCNGGYILDEKLYQTKLLDEHLAKTLELLPIAPVVADSAEPKAIKGISNRGINITGVKKEKDSIQFGIKHVQGLKISYTKHSNNIRTEYERYAWKRTKESTESEDHLGIEDPNCANHLMSGIRYGLVTFAEPSREVDYWDRLFKDELHPEKIQFNKGK